MWAPPEIWIFENNTRFAFLRGAFFVLFCDDSDFGGGARTRFRRLKFWRGGPQISSCHSSCTPPLSNVHLALLSLMSFYRLTRRMRSACSSRRGAGRGGKGGRCAVCELHEIQSAFFLTPPRPLRRESLRQLLLERLVVLGRKGDGRGLESAAQWAYGHPKENSCLANIVHSR